MNVVWTSRSVFEAMRRGKLHPFQQSRVLPPEEEEALVLGLHKHLLRWNKDSCL